jgi:glycosyltransferase involved in cell wall biosynthesis
MKIAFLDRGGWTYTADTPLNEPMGGTESALCYLAKELARLGHDVHVYNGIRAPENDGKLTFANVVVCNFNAHDVIIVKSESCGRELRTRGVTAPLVLWTQHDIDQPAIRALLGRKEVEAFDAFVYISTWQRQRYEKYFQIPAEKGCVLRNCASPAFIFGNTAPPWFRTPNPPTLFYTSTPYRGLDVLLKAFPAIRQATGATLRVYSSLKVYQVPDQLDQFKPLYEACKAMDGVEYVSSLGQNFLASDLRLSGAAALAYPSTFPETGCIAAIEAMAIGADVIATDLGAIPETVGIAKSDARFLPFVQDKEALAANFAQMAIERLQWAKNNPVDAELERLGQMEAVKAHYSWPKRALEWEHRLGRILIGNQAASAA